MITNRSLGSNVRYVTVSVSASLTSLADLLNAASYEAPGGRILQVDLLPGASNPVTWYDTENDSVGSAYSGEGDPLPIPLIHADRLIRLAAGSTTSLNIRLWYDVDPNAP